MVTPDHSENVLGIAKSQTILSQDELKLTRLGIDKASSIEYSTKNQIRSIVAPHHLLASHLMAKASQMFVSQQPETIILIGPDHYNRTGKILTQIDSWNTDFGEVKVDQEKVSQLLQQSSLVEISDAIKSEHSIYSHVSFIANYLPSTKVIPLAVPSTLSDKQLNELTQSLYSICPDCTLIASIDFSHYLHVDQSEENDALTLDLVQKGDTAAIMKLTDAFLDSPSSLIMALNWSVVSNATNFNQVAHTSAAQILQDNSVENTSYFLLTWEN